MRKLLHFVVLVLLAISLQAQTQQSGETTSQDYQAPTIPEDVIAVNTTETATDLSWRASIDNYNMSGYKLFQNGVLVETLTETNFVMTGLSPNTTYTFYVTAFDTAGNESRESDQATITTLEDIPVYYCESRSFDVNEEYIARIQCEGIDNGSDARFYSEFTEIVTDVMKNGECTITITPSWTTTAYNEGYSVWIDYNQDGDFFDPGEQVFSQSPTTQASISGTFTIPTSIPNGHTRMRIAMKYDAIPQPCEEFTYGEVEDYTVNIISELRDSTVPVISLNGAETIDLNVGDEYTEFGAIATDNIDENLTPNINITGDVDTAFAGMYTVRYNVNDTAGNNATEAVRTITVAPVNNGCTNGINTFPYTESYENTLGSWTQSTQDDINWIYDYNRTPSNGTGPSNATDGNTYIYVEASGNGTGYPNKQAVINSPCYDLSNETSATFSFSYHMYGANNMGTLALEASDDNGLSWTPIWSEAGNKGDRWLNANIDLSQYVGASVQLRFNRITGTTWKADLAIDNVALNTSYAARGTATTNSKDKNNTAASKVNSIATPDEFGEENTLTIYPNPVRGNVLNIKLDTGNAKSFRIINLYGQALLTGTVDNQINVERLKSGIYFIEVSDGTQTLTKKFIKQ
ncbi:Chitinase A1 [Kordia antarctica]|uniref:Chitinase A1 n=1 Tax=Kordia antarctica TaxID=1218801 RepID=A0A7L4ZEL1_9FLAO|nr:GEVED domain-containing protein [Kordia antarctica]QHI35172.1 Chitinase A1 [Kordia antarctica]